MAAAADTGHFWSTDESSYDAILALFDAGTQNSDEDHTWAAWEAICNLYFPARALAAGGVKYLVRREAYRGQPPDPTWSHKPDVVVVQLTMPPLVPPPAPRPRALQRDILWVECKAASHDTPGDWNNVMAEATGRLASAHPTRNVWLIVATGLKWMVFYWDPSAAPQAPPLQILSHNQQNVWPVDPRIHIAPNVPGQQHIVQGNIIRTDRANTLDFWTPGPNNLPANMVTSMLFLEGIFGVVQGAQYNATNPPGMS